jgi:ribosome-interacting GTPase 1
LGILKAKLAKYRQDLIEIKTAAGGGKVLNLSLQIVLYLIF